ncbi:DUF6122 family protein [Flavobacterium branchiicola]|uniref:DUF6122 family protein n=1 Tax=Flavobacterium branchiicola TaxID=1114875 RepID=A0ABV9PD31_9FLAO|nr:DUF6122 family protein [Flavobacterium branchiicola]MBS7253266.1 hypothetical protein [Flavobacterium branchiicola]
MNIEILRLLQSILHYSLHFLAPGLIAFIFFKPHWKLAYHDSTMLIDLDHLLATPIFDPTRCSVGFHPLHSYYAICINLLLLLFRKTKIIVVGLLFHIITDWQDCYWSNLKILTAK